MAPLLRLLHLREDQVQHTHCMPARQAPILPYQSQSTPLVQNLLGTPPTVMISMKSAFVEPFPSRGWCSSCGRILATGSSPINATIGDDWNGSILPLRLRGHSRIPFSRLCTTQNRKIHLTSKCFSETIVSNYPLAIGLFAEYHVSRSGDLVFAGKCLRCSVEVYMPSKRCLCHRV